MKKIIISAALALALGGCGTLGAIGSAPVSPKSVITISNTFDLAKAGAIAYVNSCVPRPLPSHCSRDAVNQLIPAINAGTTAESQLKQLARTNPDQLGQSGWYDKLSAAVSTLRGVAKAYNIGGIE